MSDKKAKEPPKIRVVVRKRPLFGKEITNNDRDILSAVGDASLIVQEIKQKVDMTKYIEEHAFTFDNVFESDQDNNDVYNECVLPLVAETFNGAKTTCFAYGQTGSGKTFTMMGTNDGSVSGMYTLASYDIMDLLEAYEGLELYLSFYEIYCGKLYDLLNKRKHVECREDAKQRVNIINLTETNVTKVEEIMELIHNGLKCRTSGTTGANAQSSRSHAILTYSIKHGGKLYSKMSFIDLAGSERGADVIDTGKKTKMDGAEINKSLLALKECIRALDQEGKKKNHLPFRGSKLTQVLKDSFMGNSKTTMIANVSPALSCCEPTLNTLRYADRVKELKKDPALKKGTGGDQLSKELMLARQNKNVKIIEIDQKTGLPLSQCQELAADFKPMLKKASVNPAEVLAAKRQKALDAQKAKKAPQVEEPAPVKEAPATPARGIGSGIGGGTKQSGIGGGSSGIGGGLKRPTGMDRDQGSKIGRPKSSIRSNQPQNNNAKYQQNFQPQRDQFQEQDIPNQSSARQPQAQQRQIGGNQNYQNNMAARTVPKNQLQELIDVAPQNQNLQDFDEQFDQYTSNSHRNLHGHRESASMCQSKTNMDPTNQEEPMDEDDLLDDFEDDLGEIKLTEMDDGHDLQEINIEDIPQDDFEADLQWDQDNQIRQNQPQQMQNNFADLDMSKGIDDDEGDMDFEENVEARMMAQESLGPGKQRSETTRIGQFGMNKQQMPRMQKAQSDYSEVNNVGLRSAGIQQRSKADSQQRLIRPQPAVTQVEETSPRGIDHNTSQQSQVNSFKAKLMRQKAEKQGFCPMPNAPPAQAMNNNKSLRSKAVGGSVNSTKNWRETPSKKNFFGSMIEAPTDSEMKKEGSSKLLKRPSGRAGGMASHSAVKTRPTQQLARVQPQKPQQSPSKLQKPSSQIKDVRKNSLLNATRPAPLAPEKLGDRVPSFGQLVKRYETNHKQLGEDHEKLIEQILEDEEQLIFKHNSSCKESIQIVEQEMSILKEVDKPGSDVEQYVKKLDTILLQKIGKMEELRRNVLDFYKNIKTEQQLNKLFQQIQQEMGGSDGDYIPGQ